MGREEERSCRMTAMVRVEVERRDSLRLQAERADQLLRPDSTERARGEPGDVALLPADRVAVGGVAEVDLSIEVRHAACPIARRVPAVDAVVDVRDLDSAKLEAGLDGFDWEQAGRVLVAPQSLLFDVRDNLSVNDERGRWIDALEVAQRDHWTAGCLKTVTGTFILGGQLSTPCTSGRQVPMR